LMTRYSEEGGIEGLGWIDASTKKFTLTKLKVPHMGWNTLEVSKNSTILKLGNNNHYYFVHSYYVKCENEKDILTSTNYGINFDSSFQKENITGVQFHPEKSHKTGLELLENFSKS
jgi:glutamine amidotransferase